MKMKNILAAILAVVGIAAAGFAIWLGMSSTDAEPVLVEPPAEAEQQVVAMMDTLCAGQIGQVSQYLLGTPDLGVDREPADEAGALIWDAYCGSLSYELVGECYAAEDGLVQKVQLTCLDISSVTAVLRDRSQALLESRVEEAEDTSEIYDENYEYREDFVMAVLRDATKEALEADARQMTVELTLNLSYQNDQWWIVADDALLDAISGGVLY